VHPDIIDLMNRGSFAELERRAGELLKQDASNGWLWQILAIAQQNRGRDSLPALQQAARCLPDDAVAQLNLANTLARSGRYAEAAQCYDNALRLRPDFLEGHLNLGEMQLEQGCADLAAESCARALAIQPDSAAAHHTMAKVRLSQQRLEEAVVHGRRAIALDAEYAAAHNTLGIGLAKLGRLKEAFATFRVAVNLKPDLVEAQLNLAAALRSIGHLDEAETGYRRVLEWSTESASAHVGLATVLRLQRRSEECEGCCRRALEIDPKSTAALAVLAELRADTGHFAEAEELHRRILVMDDTAFDSWAALAQLRRLTEADAGWLAAAERCLAAPLPARRELTLRYAIGKYFDDTRDFDQAFMHYRRANELSVQCAPPHDRSALSRTVDLIIRSQDRTWVTRSQGVGNPSQRPVFIIGMLRSGTTLAEQILASHPEVFGAGELTYFGTETAAAYESAAAAGTELDFKAAQLNSLGVGYLELLQRLSGDKARVVNKLPTNFFFLGLIRAVLPRARIIHMERDPRDTCLSIYFQQFEAANTYTNDLQDLAHYFGEYQRLMRHWSATLPKDAMLHVPYEQLVEDPAAWSRRMVEFLGLNWDVRCLNFHRTERAIVTASRWQVRQSISKSSVERWRNYDRYLGPLADLGQR
jgi:tetratricopeptide (TPR) repeat protein